MSKHNIKKVVLAYSGGLDTSIILKWLQTEYGAEVVTFTADLGQGEELEPARRKAQMLGVKEIFVDDLREEFVRDFVMPMFRANALYEGERGYDTQTLFADLPLDGRHHNNRPLRKLLKFIKTAAMGKRGRVTPKKARPLPGHVSNLPASSLLNYVFVKKPEPWFDFKARPSGDQVCILTLGDTRWAQ